MTDTQSSKTRLGAFWRAARWLAIGLLVLLAGVVLVFTTTPGGWLIALTLNRLGSSPAQSVEIDRIDDLLSGSTRIGHIMLSDAEGEPWLLLKGIQIDWTPLALLSSGLAIDDLTIETVELAKLPEGDESETEGAPFQLPLAFDIKRFTAPDILLGEPVAGRLARFEARGSAQVDASMSTALADLVVKRIDGVGGELVVDADYLEAEDRFNVSAKLSEPAGGVMAHLLNLAPEDAISLSATSQGSLADWRLNAAGTVNGEIVAEANLQMVAGEAGDAVSLQANGMLDRFLPPAVGQLLSGRSELVLEGLIEPERNGAVIDVFTLSSSRLTAEGRGRVAREGNVDLTASVTPQPDAGTLEFGSDASRTRVAVPTATVRVTGNAEEAAVRLEVSTAQVSGSDFSADAISAVLDFDRFSLASRSGTGTVDIRADAIGSSNDIVARAVAGGVSVTGGIAVDQAEVITSNGIRIETGVASVVAEALTVSTSGALEASQAEAMKTAHTALSALEVLPEGRVREALHAVVHTAIARVK